MRVVFFTEGGGSKGFGHLVRCKALAEEFASRGFEVQLFADIGGEVPSFLGHFDSFAWEDAVQKCKSADIVVVDSYLASSEVLMAISKSVKTVLFFDDFNRAAYTGGFVLNAAKGAVRLGYESNRDISYLLGDKYVILRREFAKQKYRKPVKKPTKVLLSFGGADNKNAAAKISTYLLKQHRNLWLTIVGSKEPRIRHSSINHIHDINAKKFYNLMYASDIGIFSCSQTLYEAMSTGLTSIGILTEQNQQSLCAGHSNSLDFGDRFFFYKLEKEFAKITRTKARRLDAKGVVRVADILIKDAISKSEIVFRDILECDKHTKLSLREWRNQPHVREQMTVTREISEEEHDLWLENLENKGARKIFVSFLDEQPFGICTIIFKDLDAEFGFYISSKNLLGYGLGFLMCEKFLTLQAQMSDIQTISSRVRKNNAPSLGLHKKLGFVVCGEDEQNYFLSRKNV
jgi:spore coat polysaccharide biosynthesis predicted glycosyltransferase SpsG/RimJ/RimL family protein N-acetyltransferase